MRERRILLLEVSDASGAVAWSECVAGEAPNYSSETIDTAWVVVAQWVAPRVLGREIDHPRLVHELLERDFRGHQMAKAAVEMGMWGLAATMAGAPLARFIGGTRTEIATGISLGIQSSPEALIEQTRTAQRNVPVTKIKQEERTRTVKVVDANGKESEVEQTYIVSIPVIENIDQPVQVPAGKKPTAFPLDELRIYRLDGTKIDVAEARKHLEKMSPIFLLRGFTGDIKPVEGVYLQALNPNCLIVVTN